MKILIVGGVAGGATAATRISRIIPQAEVILFEKEKYISYTSCGLPYYVSGVIEDKEEILLKSPDELDEKYGIDVRTFNEVISVNTKEKYLEVIGDSNKKYKETYDKLILSPGASPVFPKIKGIDNAKNIFTLNKPEDADNIKSHINKDKVKNAVIIGGGFIGIEMAENLSILGIKVTLIESGNQIMSTLDPDMARIVKLHLEDKGVEIVLGDAVTEFKENGFIVTESQKEFETDLTILSIGIKPNTEFLKDSGIDTSEKGHIKVDEHMQTNVDDVYAIGDAIEFVDGIIGEPMSLALASPVNKAARIVANVIAGKEDKFLGFLGTSIIKAFDLEVASTGFNEKRAEDLGLEYKVEYVHSNSNAQYYPTSVPIIVKVIYDGSTGRVLGAQGVGAKGINKRIDVFATAIYGKMSIFDLTELELGYAPPYGGARDPINILGFSASDKFNKKIETIKFNQIDDCMKEGYYILYVEDLSKIELNYEKIVYIQKSLENLNLDKNKKYILANDLEEIYEIYSDLVEKGFDVICIDKGYETYLRNESNLEKDLKIISEYKSDSNE